MAKNGHHLFWLLLSIICFLLNVLNGRADFDDELSESFLFCADDEFKCADGERCIWQGLKCDLIPDCFDESDEENCGPITNVPISTQCLPPNLSCGNRCISREKICDGHSDCFYGQDEICENSTKTYCEFGICSQLCEKSSETNETTCHCIPGFKLQSDGFNCKSEAKDEPFLLYTNRYDIRLKKLDQISNENDSFSLESEQQTLPLLSHLRNAIALDYYYNKTDGSVLLFWSDISLDQIFRGRLYEGILSEVGPIITYGVWTAEGLSVDWVGLHIYWIDSQLGHILVSNFDGSMTTTLISGNMQNLRALTLDPNEGLIFWTDWYEKNPRIESATMAGQKRRTLFQIKQNVMGGGWANGITCDFVVKRLYWIDAKSDSVHSIRYDGTDERQILRDPIHLAHPFAITIFDENFYFSDWKSKNIYRANKWNGSDLNLIVEEKIMNQPFDLKIVHSSRQIFSRNPCANSTCSHLCLIESATEFKCACPYLLTLERGANPRICVTVNQTLIVATRTSLSAVDIDYPDKVVFPLLSANKENITALAIYEVKTILYWADGHSNNIYMLHLNSSIQTQPRVFVKSEAQNCYGIAVDNAMGNIYYTGFTRQRAWVRVVSYDGLLKKTILTSADNPSIRNPREIVYNDGILYFFDDNRLFRCSADGRKLTELKLKSLDINSTHDAHSLSVDGKGRLIWTQPPLNVTRVLDPQTMRMQTLTFENRPNTSCSLVTADAFSGEFVFYEQRSGNLSGRYSDDPHGYGLRLKNSTRHLKSGMLGLIGMKLLERDLLADVIVEDEQEQCGKIECDHFCLKSFDDRMCNCADGYQKVQNKCELPTKRLMLLNADFDFLWLSIGESKSSIVNIPIPSDSTIHFQARYFALNGNTNKLYFIDTKLNELWENDLQTKQSKILLEGSVARLSSITVDPNSGYLYVSSYTPSLPLKPMSAGIQILHPTLSDLRKDIHFVINDTISSLEIDSTQGFIFMVTLSGISRIKLDGSNSKKVIKHNRFISKLALDRQNRRLLYITMVGNSIYSTDYNGENIKIFPKLIHFSSSRPISFESLIVDNGILYFAAQRQFRSVKLLNGMPQNETNQLMTNLTSTVLGSQIQLKEDDKIKSACLAQKCEQFCFYMGNDEKPKCDCVFSKLSGDGKSCERFSSFLAYASGLKIEFTTTFDEQSGLRNISIDSELNRKEVQALKPIKDMVKAPVALSSDPKRKLLFVSDILTEQILAIPYNQSERIVLVEHARKVEGMSYDPMNQDLYFVSEKSIKKVDLKNLKNTNNVTIILELDTQDLVRGIAVDPCEKTIYFTNWRVDKPSIEKVYFNGTERKALITTEVQTPNAIAIDYKSKRLYWLDARMDKIERMDFEGNRRDVLLSSPTNSTRWSRAFPAHPFALVIYNNRIYYSDWIHRAILSVDKLLGNDLSIHRENMHDQPMGLTIVAEDLNICGTDECSMKKLKCEDKCELDVRGKAECKCFKGRALDSNGLTCKDLVLKECGKDELSCKDQTGCFNTDEKCDGVENCNDGSDEDDCQKKSDPCKDLCFNNGTCVFEFGVSKCICEEEYTGFYCQYRKCDGFCIHGKCNINNFTGLPQCKCEFGWSGTNCQEKKDLCSQFCRNDGFCIEANNGAHCQCASNFFGLRCENCHNSISGNELVCKNDGYCSADRASCICEDGYSGLECEKDVCTDYCLNGGLCKRNGRKPPKCKCLPNYSGEHCELDFCELNPNYCQNGGVCVHINHSSSSTNSIKCLCLNKFQGAECEKERQCDDYCLNGASCTLSSKNEFQCDCTNEWYGDRCENNYGCKLDCAYGECVHVNGKYECKCPFGLGLTTDFIGHKSCTKYTANNCSQLNCLNGKCIEIRQRNTTFCECKDGWTGMLCDIPSCYNYCSEDSECSILDKHPYCKCGKGRFGVRCKQIKSEYNYLQSTPKINRSWTIMLPLVLIIFAMVIVAYFLALKRHGISFIGVQKQFQHTRMLDDELVANFENPAFSSHEDDNVQNELVSSQLIDNVYNDTVLRNNNTNGSNNTLSRPNVEQFNLLSKTG